VEWIESNLDPCGNISKYVKQRIPSLLPC
jgi:hypothetical protein